MITDPEKRKAHMQRISKMGGRPKGQQKVANEEMRQYLLKRIIQKKKELIDAQMSDALGYFTEEIVNGKRINVYKTAPSSKSAQYLIDQAAGKAAESVKVAGNITLIIDE